MKLHCLAHPKFRTAPLIHRAAPLTALFALGAILIPITSHAQAPRPSPSEQTDPYAVLSQIGQTLQVIEQEYYLAPDQDKLSDGAIRGMVSGLDPHSSYFNQQDLTVFEGSTSGKFGGIGVEVEFSDGQIIVIAPIEGSPADRAGVVPGDQIVAINGQPITELASHEVVGLMRGEIGSHLSLLVRRTETKHLVQLDLVREQIAVSSVTSQLMNGGIVYVRIKAFQEGTHREFLEALSDLRAKIGDPTGVILDLRNNPGGLVREAAALADEFLNRGVLFSTRHRGQVLRVDQAHRGGAYTSGPLVVLINEYSASAAELVAGALKDQGRARLYGAQSFGKGSVQTLLHLSGGGALKLTTALYFTPSGQTTQAEGVRPHNFIDPGYDSGPSLGALREEDLKGHLKDPTRLGGGTEPGGGAHSTPSQRDPSKQASHGLPPTDSELHLGVIRKIPVDPSTSPDLALRSAYCAVLGRVELSRCAEPPQGAPLAPDTETP